MRRHTPPARTMSSTVGTRCREPLTQHNPSRAIRARCSRDDTNHRTIPRGRAGASHAPPSLPHMKSASGREHAETGHLSYDPCAPSHDSACPPLGIGSICRGAGSQIYGPLNPDVFASRQRGELRDGHQSTAVSRTRVEGRSRSICTDIPLCRSSIAALPVPSPGWAGWVHARTLSPSNPDRHENLHSHHCTLLQYCSLTIY